MTWLIRFECVEHPWNGGVIIFEDGQAKLYRHRLSPDRPVLIQLEGSKPTEEQIQMCRHLWARLYEGALLPGATPPQPGDTGANR